MPTMLFTLRSATAGDADAIAEVDCASFRLLTFLPMLHTEAEYRPFIANVIFRDCEVTVAEDGSGIVSFLALHGEEVRLLYTRPDRIGLGAGTQLIEAAKKRRVGAGAFRPTLARAASTKREASGRSALPTGRATRRKRPTSATSGNAPRVDRAQRDCWSVYPHGGLWCACASRYIPAEANAPSLSAAADSTGSARSQRRAWPPTGETPRAPLPCRGHALHPHRPQSPWRAGALLLAARDETGRRGAQLGGLDRARAVQQGHAKPDGVRRRRRRGFQLPKTGGSIKPDGPQVGGAYSEVRAARAHFSDRLKPLVH